MANRCQICPGEPRVAVEDWRSLWLDDFYLEWGRCCNEKPFDDEPLEFTNVQTGEKVKFSTPQELWTAVAGEDKKDKFGEAIWIWA